MANRIIRDGWLDSEVIDKLSVFSENVFLRLILIADDYALCKASNDYLKSRLYPTKPHITTQLVEDAIIELSRLGLVTLYYVDSIRYLQIQKLRILPRASRSKYPGPHGAYLSKPNVKSANPTLLDTSKTHGYPCEHLRAEVPMTKPEICAQMYAEVPMKNECASESTTKPKNDFVMGTHANICAQMYAQVPMTKPEICAQMYAEVPMKNECASESTTKPQNDFVMGTHANICAQMYPNTNTNTNTNIYADGDVGESKKEANPKEAKTAQSPPTPGRQPLLEEAIVFAEMQAIPPAVAEQWWYARDGGDGWTRMNNWRSNLIAYWRTWQANAHQRDRAPGRPPNGAGVSGPQIDDLRAELSWQDQPARIAEIKSQLKRLEGARG